MREKERANRQWQGIRPRSIEVQARGQERRERERERELSENPNWRVSEREGNTDRREREIEGRGSVQWYREYSFLW